MNDIKAMVRLTKYRQKFTGNILNIHDLEFKNIPTENICFTDARFIDVEEYNIETEKQSIDGVNMMRELHFDFELKEKGIWIAQRIENEHGEIDKKGKFLAIYEITIQFYKRIRE